MNESNAHETEIQVKGNKFYGICNQCDWQTSRMLNKDSVIFYCEEHEKENK